MKKFILQIVLILFCSNSFAQDWGNWVNVGHDIEVSFKFSTKGCPGYTFARIRNTSVVTKHCEIRISFTLICNGKNSTAAVSAYNLGTNEVSEKQGSWYNADKITDIKLSKLSDKNCKDVLNTKSTSGGFDEIYYPKKTPTEQGLLKKKKEDEGKQKIKAQQDLEKQAYQNVLNAEKQQQIQQQKNQKLHADENKKRQDEYNKQKEGDRQEQMEYLNTLKKEVEKNAEINKEDNIIINDVIQETFDKIKKILEEDKDTIN